MRKKFIYIVILIVFITACSETNSVETKSEVARPSEITSGILKNSKVLNQQVVDDENVKVTLISIESKSHEKIGEYLEVKFKITNKQEYTVKVQTKEVILDGEIIDQSMVNMSEFIAGENDVESVLLIRSIDKKKYFKLPDILEISLQFLSFENYDFRAEHHLKVEI